MQTKKQYIAATLGLVLLLVGTPTVFAQEPCPCPEVQPESCVICHSGVGEEKHQEIYDAYADPSAFDLEIDSVASVGNGNGTMDVTMTFTIMKDGAAYIDKDGLPSLDQKRFYVVKYDSTTRQFNNSTSFSNPIALGNGRYSVNATFGNHDLERSNGLAYAYIADGPLDTESGGHVHLHDNVASASLAFGDVATYESAANVSGCEKCHGAPYMKHGYRAAKVAGLPDFASCKTCHYDNRDGNHQDWQILVDNPARFAEIHGGDATTRSEEFQYAYKANIMNDVHMSHAMEFPYPQSMANCVTCHEGKLDVILTDDNFTVETCKSCHPVAGPEEGTDPHRAPALSAITPHDSEDMACNVCHTAGGTAPVFSRIHSGYDNQIYTWNGVKYSDAVVVTIDSASVADNKLTIQFSATEAPSIEGIDVANISPTVMVGLYGWNTKDFIVGPHERLVDDNNDGQIARGDERALEYEVGAEHPRATTVSAANGSWEVVVDMSTWADLIADGTVKRVEIAVTSELRTNSGRELAINASARTFDLASNDFDDDYYSDIVDIEGCNTCHEALGTTFHGPDRGGSIVTCRMCHITKSRGSHLEMQSRSLDSYVHAIHSFQAFDIGDVDFSDPVQAVQYDMHVEHVYPNFTIKNCESCHFEGTYDVPDQSKSLPGANSASDATEGWDRNIGNVPLSITGPGSRACGSCHRAKLINEDKANELVSFDQHAKQGGYSIEGGDDYPTVLGEVIDTIMSLFK